MKLFLGMELFEIENACDQIQWFDSFWKDFHEKAYFYQEKGFEIAFNICISIDVSIQNGSSFSRVFSKFFFVFVDFEYT